MSDAEAEARWALTGAVENFLRDPPPTARVEFTTDGSFNGVRSDRDRATREYIARLTPPVGALEGWWTKPKPTDRFDAADPKFRVARRPHPWRDRGMSSNWPRYALTGWQLNKELWLLPDGHACIIDPGGFRSGDDRPRLKAAGSLLELGLSATAALSLVVALTRAERS